MSFSNKADILTQWMMFSARYWQPRRSIIYSSNQIAQNIRGPPTPKCKRSFLWEYYPYKLEFSGECKVKLSLKTNAIKSFGKTVENDIKSLEKVLNIKFPNDYKDFLLKTNGGSIPNDNTNEIVLKNIKKIINIDILYGVNTDNSCFDIEYWTKKYIDDLFEKTVIIGDSLQNGFIVMICDGNNDGVYYYDDSYYFDESNDENNVYIISNNFTEFLDMIVKR